MPSCYYSELDMSEELNIEDIQNYQELIDIIRSSLEICRADILTEVAMLSFYQEHPRQGHMDEILHIFVFLKQTPKLSIYFKTIETQIDLSIFNYDIIRFKHSY